MKDIVKLGTILFVFGVISALLLGITYQVTLDPITASRAKEDQQNQAMVYPEADSFEAVDDAVLQVVKEKMPGILAIAKATDGSELLGYVVKSSSNGFGGAMEVMVGVDQAGQLTGIRLGNNSETPGLGDNAKKPDFYEQFPGKNILTGIGVNKGEPGANEIQAMTGATVTSRAVVEAVNAVKIVIEEVGR